MMAATQEIYILLYGLKARPPPTRAVPAPGGAPESQARCPRLLLLSTAFVFTSFMHTYNNAYLLLSFFFLYYFHSYNLPLTFRKWSYLKALNFKGMSCYSIIFNLLFYQTMEKNH